jgi:hypothetical protein
LSFQWFIGRATTASPHNIAVEIDSFHLAVFGAGQPSGLELAKVEVRTTAMEDVPLTK